MEEGGCGCFCIAGEFFACDFLDTVFRASQSGSEGQIESTVKLSIDVYFVIMLSIGFPTFVLALSAGF